MRQTIEIDLPAAFVTKFGPTIHGWIEDAIPGSTLSIAVGGPISGPLVSSSTLERYTATLKATKLVTTTGHGLMIAPADSYSARLIDEAAARLAAPKRPAYFDPLADQPPPAKVSTWSENGFAS